MRAAAGRRLLRLAAVLATVAVGATSACADEYAVPERLADGTPARLSTIAFENVEGPVVETAVRPLRRVTTKSCPDARGSLGRVGTAGASRTWRSGNGRELRACDWTAASGWCGIAFTHLTNDQPPDPRLTVTCRTSRGNPVGFLWITPGPGTSYIVVRQRGHAESYRVVQGAPVRVTTEDVDLSSSTATVRLSRHGPAGRLLGAESVEAQVSG